MEFRMRFVAHASALDKKKVRATGSEEGKVCSELLIPGGKDERAKRRWWGGGGGGFEENLLLSR